MDDFTLTNLYESRNEWCSRLVNKFTPLIIEGIRSIFNESWKMCLENNEIDKYLMTFQNLLCRVPKWNSIIIENERMRIIEKSGCNYLEDLITCVHIIQLKALTSVRVGNKQKKIDITIPKLDIFIHKIYISVARKVYNMVYLFEKNIPPLEIQKNNRELEVIIHECILKTIQESIPTSEIIRAYLDESVEQEETVVIETIENPELKEDKKDNDNLHKTLDPPSSISTPPPEIVPTIKNIDNEQVVTKLNFNDIDTILDGEDNIIEVNVPKNIEQLEKQSMDKMLKKMNSYDDEDDDEDDDEEDNKGKLKIMNDIELNNGDLIDLDNAKNNIQLNEPFELDFTPLN
jgi:hypothetical protein